MYSQYFELQKYTISFENKNLFLSIDCSVDKNVYVCNLITKKIVTKKVVIRSLDDTY